MKSFEFDLNLSSVQLLDYYRGAANQVHARCADGTSVRFPALLLKKFVTPTGVKGHFVLTCDDDFKSPELRRLDGEH
jgi:Protein of unknown function (DUF2835)